MTKKHGGLGYAPGTQAETKATEGESVGALCFFANSGTEANEGALKIVKKVGKERWAQKAKGRGWELSDGIGEKNGIVCFEVSCQLRHLSGEGNCDVYFLEEGFLALGLLLRFGHVHDTWRLFFTFGFYSLSYLIDQC